MKDVKFAIAIGLFCGGVVTWADIDFWPAIVGGIMLGIGFAVLVDWLRDTARPPDDRARWRR